MRWLTVERGTGYQLLICKCGWRVMLGTSTAVAAHGDAHLRDVHDHATGFGTQRKYRGTR